MAALCILETWNYLLSKLGEKNCMAVHVSVVMVVCLPSLYYLCMHAWGRGWNVTNDLF